MDKQDSETLSAQAMTVYNALHEQIGFLKKQQWTMTNYLAAIYAAIFGIKKELASSLPPSLTCILTLSVAVACVYGLIALGIIQRDLGNVRKRLGAADQEVFGAREYRALGMSRETCPHLRGLFFTGALMLVLVVGAMVVISYLLLRTSS